MLLIYKPEGADERRWTFDPAKLLSSEAEAIEKVTGLTYEEFGQALVKGSAAARRSLLWVYLKREDAPLRYAQVDVPVGSIGLDYEPHELRAMRDAIDADQSLSDKDRADALAQFDQLIGDSEGEAPKADASSDDSSGSESSPTSSTSRPLRSAG